MLEHIYLVTSYFVITDQFNEILEITVDFNQFYYLRSKPKAYWSLDTHLELELLSNGLKKFNENSLSLFYLQNGTINA